jgi:hypothetical protein
MYAWKLGFGVTMGCAWLLLTSNGVAAQGWDAVQSRQQAAKPAAASAPANAGSLPGLSSLGLKPGDVVSQANAGTYDPLLPPGLKATVGLGWRLRVIEPKSIAMPRAYREATEKYAGQVKLRSDGLMIENYVAGLPFPKIDTNDPQAALKIMWNFYNNWMGPDDIVEAGVDTFVGPVQANKQMTVERHLVTDAFRRLNYTGRLYVDPKPNLPNPEGIRYKESVHPILEPFDVKGVGATFYRYLSPDKQDDSWIYLPQLRRVRRMSTAQRSDALFGQDVDADGFFGYNGQIAWMTFRLLGERTVLATMHAQNIPIKWQAPEDWLYDDVWEPRTVYVVEAVSKLPTYAYGKRVLYVDKETWLIPYSDSYDRGGQLWKVWVNFWGFRKDAMPNSPVPPYEDEMPFLNGSVCLDIQLQHCTATGLPRTLANRGAGTFLNAGEKMGVTEDFFSVANLISSGR